jgi:hypothetical protein
MIPYILVKGHSGLWEGNHRSRDAVTVVQIRDVGDMSWVVLWSCREGE